MKNHMPVCGIELVYRLFIILFSFIEEYGSYR